MDVPIEHAKQNDWQTGEDNIVQLDVPFVEDCHGTETAEVGIVVMRKSERHILVKEV